mmetsp:Transcript_64299/g.130639  ORF Transcript_64299/g.130639 Transcript_64299/m.130639 type:complete len:236 (-) Transcript_64299:7-714(-)
MSTALVTGSPHVGSSTTSSFSPFSSFSTFSALSSFSSFSAFSSFSSFSTFNAFSKVSSQLGDSHSCEPATPGTLSHVISAPPPSPAGCTRCGRRSRRIAQAKTPAERGTPSPFAVFFGSSSLGDGALYGTRTLLLLQDETLLVLLLFDVVRTSSLRWDKSSVRSSWMVSMIRETSPGCIWSSTSFALAASRSRSLSDTFLMSSAISMLLCRRPKFKMVKSCVDATARPVARSTTW